jgi:hypothetical protein
MSLETTIRRALIAVRLRPAQTGNRTSTCLSADWNEQ